MEEGSALSPTGPFLFLLSALCPQPCPPRVGTKEECARLGGGGVVSFKNKIVPI